MTDRPGAHSSETPCLPCLVSVWFHVRGYSCRASIEWTCRAGIANATLRYVQDSCESRAICSLQATVEGLQAAGTCTGAVEEANTVVEAAGVAITAVEAAAARTTLAAAVAITVATITTVGITAEAGITIAIWVVVVDTGEARITTTIAHHEGINIAGVARIP